MDAPEGQVADEEEGDDLAAGLVTQLETDGGERVSASGAESESHKGQRSRGLLTTGSGRYTVGSHGVNRVSVAEFGSYWGQGS